MIKTTYKIKIKKEVYSDTAKGEFKKDYSASGTVYEQEVEDLDLQAVIAVINNLEKPNK